MATSSPNEPKFERSAFMATKTTSADGTSKQHTAAEIKEWYEKNKKNIENYEVAQDAWKHIKDASSTAKFKTIAQLTKENVLSYLQNPSSNESNLRNVSDYLYYRSHVYMKLIDFFAGIPLPSARQIIPQYDFVKKNQNTNKTLKSYNETCKIVNRMHLDLHAKTIWTHALKEDVFFGFYWLDDTGFTIINIPADYGRIDGIYSYGNYSWSMDMSWFRSRQDYLEWWGEPIQSMYREYESSRNKWQPVPPSASVAFKWRTDDIDLVVPPFAGLFARFADLEDLADYEAIQAEQNIYKLIWMEMETITGSKNVDDFKIDPELANRYFQKMVNDALPEYAAAALVPGKLQTISFDDDAASQTNKYQNAQGAILDTAGAAQVLQGSAINSTAAFNAAMIAAERFALTTMLPQFEGWVNMVLAENLSNPSLVKFFQVGPYTKDKLKEDLLAGAQNGMPTALAYMSLLQINETETMALNNLQDMLGIPDIFKPLSTSYTQSGKEGAGRPTVDDTELSPSGERSRNQ